MYISTGAGAHMALPDRKVAAVIAAMRPLLRAADYNAAVEQVLILRPNVTSTAELKWLMNLRTCGVRNACGQVVAQYSPQRAWFTMPSASHSMHAHTVWCSRTCSSRLQCLAPGAVHPPKIASRSVQAVTDIGLGLAGAEPPAGEGDEGGGFFDPWTVGVLAAFAGALGLSCYASHRKDRHYRRAGPRLSCLKHRATRSQTPGFNGPTKRSPACAASAGSVASRYRQVA